MPAALVLDIRLDRLGNPFLHFPFMSISDAHWGTKHSRAKRLAHIFERTRADRLYAIGDMIDGEYILGKTTWNFPPWHRQGIAHICRKAEHGTQVTYVLGDHDAGIRQKMMILRDGKVVVHRNMCGKSIYGIDFTEQAVYLDPLDRRIMIRRGDQYDRTLGAAPLGGPNSFLYRPKMIENDSTVKADRLIRLIYRTWPPKERRQLKTREAWTYTAGHGACASTPAHIPLPNPHRVKRFPPTPGFRRAAQNGISPHELPLAV